MQDKKYKNVIISGFSAALMLLFILLTTNPSNLHVVIALTVPLAVSVLFYSLLNVFIGYFFTNLSTQEVRDLSLFGVLFPIAVFMLSSLKQLGLVDVVLALGFSVGFALYLKRIHQSSTQL